MARIMVVGPHPDDQELGMGGTIIRLAEQGHEVLLVDMTNGEPTPFGSPSTRAIEARRATEILSPTSGELLRRVCLDLPNRFVEHSIEARHAVAGAIRGHQAEILFIPYFEDAHPDHRATTRIVEDARFDAKLTKVDMPAPPGLLEIGPPIYPRWVFYYYATHLRWVADPRFVFDITGAVDRKIASIMAYESQFVLNKNNRRIVDWVESAATYFG
ncbi:MAG: PIG-L family deacetylase, partial [Planctomycetota bacterium]